MSETESIDTVVREILATDLKLLASLIDHELTPAQLAQLAEAPPRQWLGLELKSAVAEEAFRLLEAAFADFPSPVDAATLDRLSIVFADIFLNYTYRASPYESVWLTDENLERQQPMFDVRNWYEHYGLQVENWSSRPDDHLVLQLMFLSYLFEFDAPHAPRDAARFMDEHLLLWVGAFGDRVRKRCETPLYAGLTLLIACYAEELRDFLAAALDYERPSPIVAEETKAGPEDEEPRPYFPGMGPGW